MRQVNSKSKISDQSPTSLASLFPALFVERLIEPLFAEQARAERAAAFLGAPLAFACAQLCPCPTIDMDTLHARAAYETILSSRTRSRAVEFAENLDADQIPSIAFKGLATALSVYPYPAYRLLPDVDFLFYEKDLPRLAEWLSAHGYATGLDHQPIRAWGILTEASFAPIFQPDRTFFVDVHRAVNEPPINRGLTTDLLFARAEIIATKWGACRVTSHEHSFAIAALNLYRDFYRPEALKGLFDSCLILSRFGDRLDWTHMEEVARRGHFINRLVFFRDLLEVLGAGRAPLFDDRSVSGCLRPTLDFVAKNCRSLDWLKMNDYRKLLLEIGLQDSPLVTLRSQWRRLRGIAAPASHYLPGLPVVTSMKTANHSAV